jgi:regulator of sirC expression with transglutaminase-like and TPR domain
MPDEIAATLDAAGEAPDDGIDLFETALALGALDRPGVALDWYRRHRRQLVDAVREAAEALGDGPDAAAEALSGVLAGGFGYVGDARSYEDMQNANLLRVIDRRKGLPVALGILYIDIARAQGWSVAGLNFPGHFLIRLGEGTERTVLDPFHAGMVRTVDQMRELLKAVAGRDAELRPEHWESVGDRDILLRLQNNIKLRHLRGDNVGRALEVLETMRRIAPGEAMLLRETGLLNARIGNLSTAIEQLERFMDSPAPDRLKHQTASVLADLRSRLH